MEIDEIMDLVPNWEYLKNNYPTLNNASDLLAVLNKMNFSIFSKEYWKLRKIKRAVNKQILNMIEFGINEDV